MCRGNRRHIIENEEKRKPRFSLFAGQAAFGILRRPWMGKCRERRMRWSGPLAALVHPCTADAPMRRAQGRAQAKGSAGAVVL